MMSDGMRALVTGGAGFLGSHVVDRLLAGGGEVVALDNFATGRWDNLDPHPRLRVVEGSVADAVLVDRLFDEFRPTHVVHGAAAYRDPDAWRDDATTNVLGTVALVAAAQRAAVSRFVYLQTALCYGRPRQPLLGLDHPLEPFTSYAVSKTAGEQYVRLADVPWASLRLANVYGPRHFSGPMPAFYRRLKRGERCLVADTRRDFVEVEDFLALMDRALDSKAPSGCFNVASGRDWSIQEVFDLIAARLGVDGAGLADRVAADVDDVATLRLDPVETERVLGLRPVVPLEAGIARLIDWYERHGVDATYTHLAIGRGRG